MRTFGSWTALNFKLPFHENAMTAIRFFEQTQWSKILPAQGEDETSRLLALEWLLTHYRQPILHEITHRAGRSLGDPEDLTQQFIHNCIRREFLTSVNPSKGRFRNFIKGCIENFLKDQRDRLFTQKRGAGIPTESLDEHDEEGKAKFNPAATGEQPDTSVDVRWATEVLRHSMSKLEEECTNARRGALFKGLQPLLSGSDDRNAYTLLASRLGMTEGSLRTATHRMRQRLGELIEEEIKQTVGSEEDWTDELRYFLELLGRRSSVT